MADASVPRPGWRELLADGESRRKHLLMLYLVIVPKPLDRQEVEGARQRLEDKCQKIGETVNKLLDSIRPRTGSLWIGG